MERLSARTSGLLIAGLGAAFAAFHLSTAVALRARPALLVVEALVPLVLALAIVGLGMSVREGGLVPPQFADRALAWVCIGTVTVAGATAPLYIIASIQNNPAPAMPGTAVNAATLGALGGLVIGIYDARAQRQRERATQLTRINNTLRIATQEVVNATDRASLEQAVCDRLTQSDIYDSTWVGRYRPEEKLVEPVAWAGHDPEYIESLEITTDPDEPLGQGAGGEAVRTGEIQCVQNVFEDPGMEPWWDLFESRGVESIAVVPFVGEDEVYGFISIYANRVNAFDAAERSALTELGESIGHAIDAIIAREQLAKRERELKRKNEQLDEFASVVSHDLRNPLNVAEGNVELALTTGETAHLEPAVDALDRMDELIDDVLTLARSGQTVSECAAVDLQSVAERAWATTNTAGATLRFEDDLGHIRADESRLVQMFENLFRNSVEHGSTDSRAEPGESVEHGSTEDTTEEAVDRRHGEGDASAAAADLTVTVGRTDDGFYVEDDGRGIPEAERDEVFRTGHTTSDGGTGLGLSIVRSIAEAQGWTVEVTESDAGGARFEFHGVEPATDVSSSD